MGKGRDGEMGKGRDGKGQRCWGVEKREEMERLGEGEMRRGR